MKTFDMYRHPILGTQAVKKGLSWPAFFVGPFWMLVKRLWRFAAAWLAFSLVLGAIEYLADESDPGIGQALTYLIVALGYFTVWLVPAFKGNEWRTQDLLRRGFVHMRTVEAQTPDAALAQWGESKA